MHSRFRHFVLAALVSTPLLAQPLRIYHIDVEQGDATLLVAPNGKTLLVDGGRTSDGLRIKAAMDAAGVNRIDFFVNTHCTPQRLPNEQIFERGSRGQRAGRVHCRSGVQRR